jgi:hypothetical protein
MWATRPAPPSRTRHLRAPAEARHAGTRLATVVEPVARKLAGFLSGLTGPMRVP